MYRYRVDSQEPLTRLTTSLNPRRWDSKKSDKAPHKPLIATQVALPPGHGIYRMSFWKSEKAARRDLTMRDPRERQVLLRVSESRVSECLSNWTLDPDELVKDADLYWKCEPVPEGDPTYHPQGVPLDFFEVWCDHLKAWQPWHGAWSLLPLSARMAQIGFTQEVFSYKGQPNTWFFRVLFDQDGKFLLILCQDRSSNADEIEAVISHVYEKSVSHLDGVTVKALHVFPSFRDLGRLMGHEYSIHLEDVSHLDDRSWIQRLVGIPPSKHELRRPSVKMTGTMGMGMERMIFASTRLHQALLYPPP